MSLPVSEVTKTAKDVIETAHKTLELYDKAVDRLIPWKSFEETIQKLGQYQESYSSKAAPLVGKVKTLLLNSQNEYYKATQSVFEWTGIVKCLIPVYIELFESHNEEKAKAQKDILLSVLSEGITKMNSAQDALTESSKSFNQASGELVSLNTTLKNDFEVNSGYYQGQVEKIRKEAYAGAVAGIAAGPFGLLISYSIAAGVVEGKLIPQLNARLDEVKNSFIDITEKLKDADKNIVNAKNSLTDEIKNIGDLKVQTENTRVLVGLSYQIISAIKIEAEKLIELCDNYRSRHSNVVNN